MGLLDFPLGQHKFENDTFYAIKQWVQVPFVIRRSYENWNTKYFNQFKSYLKKKKINK